MVRFSGPCSTTPRLVREVCLSESIDLLTGFSRLLRWRNLTKNPSILTDELRGPAAAWISMVRVGIAGPSLSTTQNHDFLWFSSNIFVWYRESSIRVRLKRFQYERTPYSKRAAAAAFACSGNPSILACDEPYSLLAPFLRQAWEIRRSLLGGGLYGTVLRSMLDHAAAGPRSLFVRID